MGGDDDIAASLPRPPLPAPARRETAIAEALRRFDGGGAPPATAAQDRRPAWFRPGRPYAGALAGAFLVALIGLPFAWTSFDRYAADGNRQDRSGIEASSSPPAMADETAADLAIPQADATAEPPAVADEAPAAARAPLGGADPIPVPIPAARPAEPGAAPGEEAVADSKAMDADEIQVTGSRIHRPDLAAAGPTSTAGSEAEAAAVTALRSARSAPARRGDWNACTIDDPKRDLRACRRAVDPSATGASGRAAAQVADGLSSAWQGDLSSAMAAFDRAIELAPRSSAAYLNRGLAWRRRGDLDRALADLDRAIAHAPNSARGYYLRSLVLRQRGEGRRARADEERAVELDPAYSAVVGAGSGQKR